MNNEIKYIKKVVISGLWDNIDITWDLNPDVNILAGINGSGKTTILDCICGLILMRIMPSNYLGIVKKIELFFDNGERLIHEYIKDTIKNIEKKAKTGDFRYKGFLSKLKENEGNNYKKIHSVAFGTNYISSEDKKMELDDIYSAINVDVISTFDNSLKLSEAVKKLSDDEVKTELDWEIYHLQKEYLDYQLNISKRISSLLEENDKNVNINKKFTNLKYPQEKFLEIIDNLFSETGKKINRDKNQIEFLLNDKEIKYFQLSSGEKQLIIILLTVLIQDNKPSILFMDEPEISLHIEWQKKIIQYIRELNPNVQVIMATHSPALVMEGWMDKVFEVRDITVNK
jgi:energy-coupling factor transporter ATP-binding protein EcfA2